MGCQFRVNVAIIGSLYIKLNKVQLQSSFNFKSTAFCEFAFASCGFTENVFAVVAGDNGLGVAEDNSSLIAASALDVHEIGVGGGNESFEFV